MLRSEAGAEKPDLPGVDGFLPQSVVDLGFLGGQGRRLVGRDSTESITHLRPQISTVGEHLAVAAARHA